MLIRECLEGWKGFDCWELRHVRLGVVHSNAGELANTGQGEVEVGEVNAVKGKVTEVCITEENP